MRRHKNDLPPPHPKAAKFKEAAEWAADLFEVRTRHIAADAGRIDEALPDTRVAWSEIRRGFELTASDRAPFQPFFETAISNRGLLGVLRRSESAVCWVERMDKATAKRGKTPAKTVTEKLADLAAAMTDHGKREPRHMEVMAYMDCERRACRIAARAILLGDERESAAAKELATLVLSAVQPEPEDPDYEEYFKGRKSAKDAQRFERKAGQ